MIENGSRLLVIFKLGKIVPHYENDVNIPRGWFRGDVTAEDNAAFEFAGTSCDFINAHKPRCYQLTLGCAVTEALQGRRE